MCSMLEAGINIDDTSRWRAKEEKRANMSNDKGFWEGGVMPNTWNRGSFARCLDLRC